MIINRIRAQNILKYAELNIDVADHGLIAISGQNESGKSSIGEAVCFALFGRTFSIGPDDIQKVVRWGENHCNVNLEFSVEDRRYVLSRFLDRDGNHSAKLSPADAPDEPIARGVQPVAEALFGILGYAYEEFVESFYLAQREITTPHPHSQAVRIMAGVAPMETVIRGLKSEITEREELVGEFRAEWEAVDRDVKALGIQEGYLPKLEDQRHQTSEQLDQVNALVGDIHHGLDVYVGNSARIERERGRRGRAALLRFLFLVLALVAGGLWALLTFAPDLPQAATARDLLAQNLPQWSDDKRNWIGYLAAGLGVLFLLMWGRVAAKRSAIEGLQEESGQLGGLLAQARELAIEDMDDEGEDAGDAEPDAEYEGDAEQAPSRPADIEYEALRRMLESGEGATRMAQEYCEREQNWLGYVAGRLSAQLTEMDEEIDEEQARLQEAIDLSEVLNGLTDKREEVEERIADRKRGLELLDGAVAHLSSLFNRDIKDLVARLLPLFTDGRYEHLQIDSDLKVRVFSSEKRDFMDLEEVSSGTQRQIMLALRLALSKKLLSRTVKGKQFAFLDEPFAFFDQERTCRALNALTDLGGDISQVFIVTQDFPEDCELQLDTRVSCERGNNVLNVSG